MLNTTSSYNRRAGASTLRSVSNVAPTPSISVVGLGYVGTVSAACLAMLGHKVVGVDVDASKVSTIAAGLAPIHEQDLERLLRFGVHNNLIDATTDIFSAVQRTDITFISVGTPTAEDGGCDDRAIRAVAHAVGQALRAKTDFHTIVMRCSIPPGTTLGVMVPIVEEVSGKRASEDFGVCFNPEFLREGTAIEDFRAPPKTVLGVQDSRTAEVMSKVYEPVDANPIITSIEAAEMVKYVDNVWHATKVCFANEIGRLCKPLEVDSHQVMDIFVQDHKLNLSPYYLKPGFAFGGSCLPKEVRAVQHLAQNLGAGVPLIESLIPSNTGQIDAAIEAVRATGAKRIGVLGLAFKPGTDDLRESPVLEVINALAEQGCEIVAYDPAIRRETKLDGQFAYVQHACPHLAKLIEKLPGMLREDVDSVVNNVDAVIVTHANPMFEVPVKEKLGSIDVIDLARLFPAAVTSQGYFGIAW